MAHIVVAPDSFKGSVDASVAAAAIAQGWLRVRPRDTITALPQADGGEGTLEAIEAAVPGATRRGPVTVSGPDGRRTQAWWLELADGTAVVELASAAGLPLMERLDALGASTRGLGELLTHVLDGQPHKLIIALGGSATTDGAVGRSCHTRRAAHCAPHRARHGIGQCRCATPQPAVHRLSLNQATIKYASLNQAVEVTARAGIPAIGLWREPVAEAGLAHSAKTVRDAGLRVSSLCRGGFFTLPPGLARDQALDDNRRAIDEAAALGAPVLVLVVGGLPEGSRDLVGARLAVADALAELVSHAAQARVALAIEPLHPMYAADRAVVSTLAQALDLAAPYPAEHVQVVVDAFHVWWDPDLAPAVARAGAQGRIASYQICDFVTPLASDALLSRGLPGDGHIDFAALTAMVRDAGYTGDIETEVFRQDVWDSSPTDVAHRVVSTFQEHVAPHL